MELNQIPQWFVRDMKSILLSNLDIESNDLLDDTIIDLYTLYSLHQLTLMGATRVIYEGNYIYTFIFNDYSSDYSHIDAKYPNRVSREELAKYRGRQNCRVSILAQFMNSFTDNDGFNLKVVDIIPNVVQITFMIS